MRFILEQLRQARKREEGFTLIELLIVILILGILAGIAVFASGPFRNRAEQACTDANTEIAVIADAAVDAGVTGDLYAQSGDCSGTGGGGPRRNGYVRSECCGHLGRRHPKQPGNGHPRRDD